MRLARAVPTEEVVAAARRLIDAAGITRPPVDLTAVGALQGVRSILVEPLDGADAKLSPIHEGFVIRVNARAPQAMRRFSIAHEIAHTFFNHNHESYRNQTVRLKTDTTGGTYRLEEDLCDRAAAELLMPREMFIREGRGKRLSVSLIAHLSETFDTSIKSTAIRYASLFELSAQIATWRKRDQELRATWRRGPTILEDEDRVLSLEEPEFQIHALLGQAYSNGRSITKWESIGNRRIHVDAKSFGTDESKYLLSVLTSPTSFD